MNNVLRFPTRAAATALISVLLFGAAGVQADGLVKVSEPWIRATVPGQKVAGVYMKLTGDKALRLNGAKTPVASSVELHLMRMEGGVMAMRRIAYLDLPAGKPVTLEPGGYHLMLFGVKVPLKAGDVIPVTLDVTETGKVRQPHKVVVYAQVRPAGTEPAKPAKH